MSAADSRSSQSGASATPQILDERLQTFLLAFGYGISAMVLCSTIANVAGVIAGGLGALSGVLLFRWHVGQKLRNIVPALSGLALILFGLFFPQWLGRGWIVPTVIGISPTLVVLQTMTLATIGAGIVLIVRSLSHSARVFSMLDGVAMITAIGLRFAAHRNYHWGNPRFFSDWAGIQGYELPLLFALLGLAALLIGLIASMRRTDRLHAATSIISILLLFLCLLWIGGKFLRNLTFEITPQTESSSGVSSGGGNGGRSETLDDTLASGSASSESAAAGSAASGSDASNSDAMGSGETGSAETGASGDTGATAEDHTTTNARLSSGRGNKSNDPIPKAASQSSSPQPIAVILLEEDVDPYEQIWYFRQTAVSLFNGKRLVTAPDDTHDTDIPSGFSDKEVFIGGVPLPENMHQIVPLVVNLIVEQPRPFSLPSMISFAPLPNPNTNFFRQSYRATSCVLTNEIDGDEIYDLYSSLCYYDSGNSQWNDSVREHYTQSPEDPRYQQLAEEIVAERITSEIEDELQDSAMLKALAIKRWLEKNTTYSEDPKFDNSEVNPAEQFLFGERYGYCVHIAHASVYLMRSLGIPARIGTGYMVPTERSGKSSSILIQSTDAHAWAEIYLQDAGWIIVDAFPEKIDESTQLPPEPDKTLSQFLADKARGKDKHQKHIQEPRKFSRGFPLRMKHLPWALLLGILVLYGIKFWILLLPRFANDSDLIRATQRATILQLAEIGIQRQFGETRTEFGARLAKTYPEFANLSECHLRQTYGRGHQLARNACLDIQKRTSKRVHQTTSFLKWIMGRLDPRFWILVR